MQDMPLVSVLMGIYNVETTLQEAVDSIINQTYDNWELIMCDDCSSDNTYSLAISIAKKDSRIKVLKNEKNLTLSPTLNKCLKEARGQFVARMDGDDVCDATRFEKEVNFLINNPEYSLVSTRMNLFDEEGIFRTTNVSDFPNEYDLVKGPPFCHAGCMMKTSVLRKLNGYDSSEKKMRVEDYDLWYRLYMAGYKGANIQEALYSMRDDRNAFKRRKLKYRLNYRNVTINVIKSFNLPWKYYLFTIKPIVVGFLPHPLYKLLHRL